LRTTFSIAEAFELDPTGILFGDAWHPAKRFESEQNGANNALLNDVPLK